MRLVLIGPASWGEYAVRIPPPDDVHLPREIGIVDLPVDDQPARGNPCGETDHGGRARAHVQGRALEDGVQGQEVETFHVDCRMDTILRHPTLDASRDRQGVLQES